MNDHIPAEDFAAYIDGMLSPEKKNELESHFASCPACLDELLEIAEIMRSRHKIPAQFIKQALGEKSKAAKPVLHMRLVFEVAAVLVVVVFIGYLFLDNNRFWQTPEQQKTSFIMEKNLRPADTSTALRKDEITALPAKQRERTATRKENNEQTKIDVDQRLADSLVPEKRKSVVGDKGVPVVISGYVQTGVQENKLSEIAEEKPQPVIEKEKLEKNRFERVAAKPETFSDVQMDFAVKDQTAVKVMKKKAAEAEQNPERQKKPEAGVAPPCEGKEEKFKDEESQLQSSVTVPETIVADQAKSANDKEKVALARKGIAGKITLSPIRIEGDTALSDLRNPELLFAWSWFKKDMVLELQIDGTGTVVAVVPLGKFDQPLVRQAENEAKKLIFSVSKKKLRRARLVVN